MDADTLVSYVYFAVIILAVLIVVTGQVRKDAEGGQDAEETDFYEEEVK